MQHLFDIPQIQLKSLLRHPDGWLTSGDLYDCVASHTTDALILPLSEVLRFSPDEDLQSLLLSLLEIEHSPDNVSRRTEEKHHSDSELLFHEVQHGKYEGKHALIALKHSSLYNTPFREVHGGATPEEVIVPYLVISKRDEQRPVYRVDILTSEVSIKNPVVYITVEPIPHITPVLIWKGKEKTFSRQDEQWSVSLQGFKVGEYQIEIQIEEQQFEFTITIKGGFKEEDLL